jgi:predicted RNase H-like HicB family nuclease
MLFTANIERGENGFYVGQIVEVPAVITQGKTLKSLHRNLVDALNLVLETSKISYQITSNFIQ